MKLNIKLTAAITCLILATPFMAFAETLVCEGVANDVNASENPKFAVEIKRDTKNPIFKNGVFYKATIKYFFSTGTSFTGIDIAEKVSARINTITYKGSFAGSRNLVLNLNDLGEVESAVMNYDSNIINQPVSCQIVGALPKRPVCTSANDANRDLVEAAKSGFDIDTIETAIECGANVNLTDKNGCTAVMFAIEPTCGLVNSLPYKSPFSKVQTILDVLTNNGAFVAVADKNGETPLMKAAKNGISDVYDTFVGLEADFDAQDKFGNTALMYAVKSNDGWITEQILEGNPNRKLTNSSGKTAYDLAVESKNETLIDLVRIADSEILIKGQADGTCTPLEINLNQGQVADLILQATDKMFKLDSKILELDLMADRNSVAKKTFNAKDKGTFKFACGFHGAGMPSEGVIVVK